MSEPTHDAMISRDDIGGDGSDHSEASASDLPGRDDSGSDEARGEGLGSEEGLLKAELGGMDEVQAARDEINERGFIAADEDQAERLLEEDRAGSLPNPREPEHEAERKAELAAADERVHEAAAEADNDAYDPDDDPNA